MYILILRFFGRIGEEKTAARSICHLLLADFFDPEDESHMLLPNIGGLVPNCTVLQPEYNVLLEDKYL
jgi:hypothetical protein